MNRGDRTRGRRFSRNSDETCRRGPIKPQERRRSRDPNTTAHRPRFHTCLPVHPRHRSRTRFLGVTPGGERDTDYIWGLRWTRKRPRKKDAGVGTRSVPYPFRNRVGRFEILTFAHMSPVGLRLHSLPLESVLCQNDTMLIFPFLQMLEKRKVRPEGSPESKDIDILFPDSLESVRK